MELGQRCYFRDNTTVGLRVPGLSLSSDIAQMLIGFNMDNISIFIFSVFTQRSDLLCRSIRIILRRYQNPLKLFLKGYSTLRLCQRLLIPELGQTWPSFISYQKEVSSWSRFQSAVLDFCILSQVLCVCDSSFHSRHGQEGRQISGVRRNQDQSKEPPQYSNHSRRDCFGHDVATCMLSMGYEANREVSGKYISHNNTFTVWL